MAKKRRYSDEDRASALAMLDANGGDVAKTARQTKVPRGTLRAWVAGQVPDAVANIRQDKKGSIAEQCDTFAARVLELTTDEDIEAASLSQRFTAFGIAIDKSRLLRGQPTIITKSSRYDLSKLTKQELRSLESLAGRAVAESPGDQSSNSPL